MFKFCGKIDPLSAQYSNSIASENVKKPLIFWLSGGLKMEHWFKMVWITSFCGQKIKWNAFLEKIKSNEINYSRMDHIKFVKTVWMTSEKSHKRQLFSVTL